MRTALVAFVLGALVALLLTPLVRRWARSRGLLDLPNDARRVHKVPTPRSGGLAIAAGVLAPIAGLAIYENQISALIYDDRWRLGSMLAGALVALLIGLLDDLYKIPARYRLLAIFSLALFEWFAGHRVDAVSVPYAGVVELGFLSLPVTVMWIAGVIVAFNFIDGLDGLAAGVALIGTLTMAFLAYVDGNLLWLTWTAAMGGALIGFLFFNFNPASIFMGDSGSNFLGFVMALVALETSRKGRTAMALLVPMLAVGLPILDAALTMVRRALLRQGMFRSERGHIHHRLLDLGLTQKKAVFVLYGFTVVLSIAGLALVFETPILHLVAATAIAAAVFALMFVTGYIRVEDLRLMYRQGLRNLARAHTLRKRVALTAARLQSGPIRESELPQILEPLLGAGGLSGISLAGRDWSVDLGHVGQAQGDASLAIPLAGPGTLAEIRFVWQSRSTELTDLETRCLKDLARRLEAAKYASDALKRKSTSFVASDS
jgi:UDP-GlcNAc:undecaprenyl-phosphate GlcNAc-1-phosphate transferase